MSNLDPRQTMAHLPRFLQPLLTWLTGKPLPGQRPLFLWNPWTRILPNTLQLVAGVSLVAIALATSPLGLLLLPLGWLLIGGALRAYYLELAHNAVHGAWSASKNVNRWVTEVFTTVTLTAGYDLFYEAHVKNHHGYTATPRDPDFAALLAWKFLPGTPVTTLRRRLIAGLLGIGVHGSYLRVRLLDNFARGPLYRRAMAIAWHGGLLAVTATTGAWALYTLAYLLPLTWAYQNSSLLQMLGGEHRWGLVGTDKRADFLARTYGRMLGEAYPHDAAMTPWGLRLARTRWWVRLLAYHLPAKLFVFVGNDIGPAHDLHHRKPLSDWANAIYTRQQMIDNGTFGPHEDRWGSLGDHIAYTLNVLASRRVL